MKFCQSCGASLDDNAKFCIECGASVPEAVTYSEPVDYSSVRLISSDAVKNTVRNCARSKLFLVATILFTLTWIMSLINAVLSVGNSSAFLDAYYSAMLGENASSIVPSYSYGVGSIIATVISAIPVVLMCVGMWITYASAAGRKDRMSTAGLTMIKVISIIYLVLMCIAAGLMVILFVMFIVLFNTVDISQILRPEMLGDIAMGPKDMATMQVMLTVVLVVMFVIIAIAFTLSIIYYAKIIKTINVIKSAISTGTITGKASAFVAVMAIIAGAASIFSTISTLVFGMYIAAVASLLSGIASILFGALLFAYRSKMASISA